MKRYTHFFKKGKDATYLVEPPKNLYMTYAYLIKEMNFRNLIMIPLVGFRLFMCVL